MRSQLERFYRRQRQILTRILIIVLAVFTFAIVLAQPHRSAALSPPLNNSQTGAEITSPQATALIDQGRQRYAAGQYAEAIALWQQALEQATPLQQIQCLNFLALAHHRLGNGPQAEQAIAESWQRLQAGNPPPQLLAQTFNTQGQIQLSLGQPDAALASWEQAAAHYAAAQDRFGELGSQINQAQALQTLGLYRRAQTQLEAVDHALQAQPDSPLKLLGLKSLGTVLQVTGRLTESQQTLQQSLALAEELGLQQQISGIQFSLANALRRSQPDAALQLYQQAATSALSPVDKLQAQLNQLSLLIDRQQETEAEALALAVQPPLSQLAASRDAVYLQVNLATQLGKLAARQAQHRQTAAQILTQASQQAQKLADLRAESAAVGQLAHLYEQTQQWDLAQSLSQRALLLAQSIDAADIAYRWQWQLGRILKQSDLPAAKAAYQEALRLLDGIRRDLLSTQPEFQVSFRADVEPLHRELVELLVEPNASQTDLQQARSVIEALRLAELENFFRSACIEPAQQIDRIDPSAAVFYPILLPERLLVIVSLPHQPLRYHAVPVSQPEVETLVAAFRRDLILPYSSERQLQRLGQQLYAWIVQPVAEALADESISTLVFVPDGVLQTIPMAALYDGKRYLVETYSLALTPGLQLFGPKPLNQIPLQAVTAGLTESRHNFESLEFVEVELNQIRDNIPSSVLLNQDFTSTALSNTLNRAQAPIVHIATHGQFSSQAEQTFILAWDQPITVSRFSQLLQTAQQPNTLELLVLSACETAVSDKQAALGLAGIAVESGARSTLASLWLIDDQSTPILMQQFYQQLKTRISKAAALRQAQLTLLQGEYRHPRWWAAFVLLGNWR